MKNPFLLAAGCASFLIAVLHVFIIIGGAEWYRFFGAGEQMATLAEQGSLEPVFITLFVTLVFTVWGLYAFSGAGMIRALPLRKSILIVIASILTLRGLAIVSPLFGYSGHSAVFMFWSSFISLALGGLYIVGIKKAWLNL